MGNKEVTTDKNGITFHPPTHTYMIEWWKLEYDGLAKWLEHLSEKRWFTDNMYTRLIEIYQNREVLSNHN